MEAEWKDIETAPKDGKPFVAWSLTLMDEYDEDDNLIARGKRYESPCIAYWFFIPGLPGGEFVEMPYRNIVTNRTFTHWLPLPTSPLSPRHPAAARAELDSEAL